MISSILTFIVILSVLILVHELGHFLVARKNGILVEEFGFGLPPKIWGKKIGQTLYSINLLPFGGFVRLHGELEEAGKINKEKAFLYKPKWVKILVIIAGVVMNFLLAVFAFSFIYFFTGIPQDTGKIKVYDVVSGSPAHQAKIIPGDYILTLDSKNITSVEEFSKIISEKKGNKVKIGLEGRNVTLTPRVEPPIGEGPIGVSISTMENVFPPIWQRPFIAIYYGFKDTVFWSGNIFNGLASVVADISQGQVPQDVSGPIGIYQVTAQVSKQGFLQTLNLLGIISVNLAVLNIMPIPALDGGRLVFIIFESIFGKKIIPKVEATIHFAGFVLLIGLILIITIGDITRLNFFNNFLSFLNSLF